MSVQCAAVASQKFTWPGLTGVDPATTLAVKVTAAPETTEAAGPPEEVTVKAVVVAVFERLKMVVVDEAKQLLLVASATALVSLAQASR
jgi:hypothetical protein